jgi:hypothetical protein
MSVAYTYDDSFVGKPAAIDVATPAFAESRLAEMLVGCAGLYCPAVLGTVAAESRVVAPRAALTIVGQPGLYHRHLRRMERRRATDQLRLCRRAGVLAPMAPQAAAYLWDGAGGLLMDSTNVYIYTGGTAPA